MGKTKEEIQKRHLAILDEMDQMDQLAQREKRAFTEAENKKYDALIREDNRLHIEIQGMMDAKQLAELREHKSKDAQLRELLNNCRKNREDFSEVLSAREAANAITVLKDAADGNAKANLEAGGLVPITIKELIDTKVPGLELPDDLPIVTGVTGDEIYPYCVDDVKVTVAGEVEKVSEQAINFDKIKAAAERVAAAVAVSNRAIDNANFDLLGFVTYKIRKALAMSNALHVYSHCAFSHALKSPFAAVTAEEITLDENFGKNLAKKIAELWDKGFEGEPELVMDKATETELLFTRRIPGQIGDRTVIEGDRCLGYRYKVSPYVNYALDGTTPKADGNHYIGIGHWGYLPFEQHGEARLTIDATSAAVAERNSTVIVFSTELSLTELSSKVNGNQSGKPQAFKLIKVVEPAES